MLGEETGEELKFIQLFDYVLFRNWQEGKIYSIVFLYLKDYFG
jgi:hypothetical protein